MQAPHVAQRVDTEAETELYRRLAPRVRFYGLRHLRDPHAAADLVQQVLLMTLERLRAGKLEIRRGTARREELLRAYGDTPEAVNDPEPQALDLAKLSACLERLAERERSVLVFSFFADKPAAEVARELGLTPVSARDIRHRALLTNSLSSC